VLLFLFFDQLPAVPSRTADLCIYNTIMFIILRTANVHLVIRLFFLS